MPETPDFAALWREAMVEPIENYKELRRQITKETNSPLEGEGEARVYRHLQRSLCSYVGWQPSHLRSHLS